MTFAERTGHRFFGGYDSKLKASVYTELLHLAAETAAHLQDLEPRDMMDVQSFIWIVGAYDGTAAVQPLEAQTMTVDGPHESDRALPRMAA